MTYLKTKTNITQLVMNELPDSEENIWKMLPVDALIFKWWVTGRGGSGLRLSDQGAQAFEIANIAHYEFPIELNKFKSDIEWEAFIRKLAKKLACPYYLNVYKKKENKKPHLRIYNHKIAMMLTLYGSINEYMESVK